MKLNYEIYRRKVRACFVGKSVGGTLGMPYEGPVQVNNVTYYDPVPNEMVPNDDLDLQVTFLEILMREGLPVSRLKLGDLWNLYNSGSLPDEYGVANANYRKMIYAPLSGVYNNAFHSGMGAAIRSELWACLAPGDPELAVRIATEDACVDHSGDGISAIRFLAAIESAAFAENDLNKLIETGMRYLPEGERMKNAFKDTIAWWNETEDYIRVREKILEKYSVENWTDVTINLSFILLALLSCENSFDKAICHAVNMGHDADCTGATVGALFGIINPDGIGERWTRPIGNSLVLSCNMTNMTASASIDDFCDEIAFCCEKIQEYYHSAVSFEGLPADRKQYAMPEPRAAASDDIPYEQSEALITDEPLEVRVIYPEAVAYMPGGENKFTVHLINNGDKPMSGSFSIGTSQNVICEPRGFSYSLKPYEEEKFTFSVEKSLCRVRINVNKVVLAFITNGLKWSCSFGFPDARVYHVENLDTGEKYDVNVPGSAFTVPAGRYRYTLNFKLAAMREIRLSHNGKARMTVYLNGERITEREADMKYVPAFHRGSVTKVTPKREHNVLEIEFNNDREREAFIEFGSVGDCGIWLTDVECEK